MIQKFTKVKELEKNKKIHNDFYEYNTNYFFMINTLKIIHEVKYITKLIIL